ncbi:hypothetical protein TNCV_3113971 [Trichonephila clavipes]|nr:hypothetical protein TNCV_3113971 [Trichonephila clavipes]
MTVTKAVPLNKDIRAVDVHRIRLSAVKAVRGGGMLKRRDEAQTGETKEKRYRVIGWLRCRWRLHVFRKCRHALHALLCKLKAELRCECIRHSVLIDECRITEFFSDCIVNFMKNVHSILPDMMLVDNELYPVQAWKKAP